MTVTGGSQSALQVGFGILNGILFIERGQGVESGARVETAFHHSLDGGSVHRGLHLAGIHERLGRGLQTLGILRIEFVVAQQNLGLVSQDESQLVFGLQRLEHSQIHHQTVDRLLGIAVRGFKPATNRPFLVSVAPLPALFSRHVVVQSRLRDVTGEHLYSQFQIVSLGKILARHFEQNIGHIVAGLLHFGITASGRRRGEDTELKPLAVLPGIQFSLFGRRKRILLVVFRLDVGIGL